MRAFYTPSDTTLHSEKQSSDEPASGGGPVTIESLNASWYEMQQPSIEESIRKCYTLS
jgi:hypothetical protein